MSLTLLHWAVIMGRVSTEPEKCFFAQLDRPTTNHSNVVCDESCRKDVKNIFDWQIGVRKELFLHPTISKNYSRYGQGCRRVGWSSLLPTSSLVLSLDISLEFFWVSATDIIVQGYIRLLFPCWSVMWFVSCTGCRNGICLYFSYNYNHIHSIRMTPFIWIG